MEKAGTFLVTHAEEDTAVLKDVVDRQVHTLATNPGVEANDALEATIAPKEPMEVAWEIVEIEDRRSLTVERSEEPPTTQERDIVATQDTGELTTRERAGVGELHVLTVPPERVEESVADVLDDEATLARAARLGVERVEVRADTEGVVSVRYLP